MMTHEDDDDHLNSGSINPLILALRIVVRKPNPRVVALYIVILKRHRQGRFVSVFNDKEVAATLFAALTSFEPRVRGRIRIPGKEGRGRVRDGDAGRERECKNLQEKERL